MKDGQTQRDTVTITGQTRLIMGVLASVVVDVADHGGAVIERTSDWYAEDTLGNVWYLGEDTVAFGRNGKPDTSRSWQAGVSGAQPGIIMETSPRSPTPTGRSTLPAKPRTRPGSSTGVAP